MSVLARLTAGVREAAAERMHRTLTEAARCATRTPTRTATGTAEESRAWPSDSQRIRRAQADGWRRVSAWASSAVCATR